MYSAKLVIQFFIRNIICLKCSLCFLIIRKYFSCTNLSRLYTFFFFDFFSTVQYSKYVYKSQSIVSSWVLPLLLEHKIQKDNTIKRRVNIIDQKMIENVTSQVKGQTRKTAMKTEVRLSKVGKLKSFHELSLMRITFITALLQQWNFFSSVMLCLLQYFSLQKLEQAGN